MDGLTVSTANDLLNTGKTVRDIKREKSHPHMGEASSKASFSHALSNAVNSVNRLQLDANKKMQELSTGKNDNISEVMVATEKAEIALKLMIQVRNKLIDAYNEVLKMQV